MTRLGSRAPALAPLVASLVLLGCEPSRGEVREWKATDHDNAKPGAADTAGPERAMPQKRPAQSPAQTVWTTACARCHGPAGKGDGPSGRELGAPDLTRDDWLKSVTDAQIADAIKNGKGDKMPPNPNLPDSVVQALVARIRNKGR